MYRIPTSVVESSVTTSSARWIQSGEALGWGRELICEPGTASGARSGTSAGVAMGEKGLELGSEVLQYDSQTVRRKLCGVLTALEGARDGKQPGRRASLVQHVEIFAWLEANGAARGNCDFSTGAGVASHAGFARLDGENTETTQLDAVVSGQRLLHGFEDGVNRSFRLRAWQAGPVHHTLNQVLLNQTETFPAVQLQCLYKVLSRW